MIKRYTRPAMGALFTDAARYDAWLAVELAVCAAWAARGEIPRAAADRIKKKARYDLKRIEEIEAQVYHDVIAFTTSVGEYIGADSAWFHRGLTSNDVVDTAQGMILKQAGRLLEAGLVQLRQVVGARAREHKYTPCIGRTHGVHAEPTTFGLRLAVWYDELSRHEERLAAAIDQLAVGKLSGAVGNFANIPPAIEEEVLKTLGLLPAPASSQVIQRDRHAQFVCALAGLGATLEKIAVSLRTLQRTELGEAQEPFAPGQKGSSAMPHKKNPILLERVTGMARVLRGYAVTALENVALWDERDISHSGAERVILPDACILLDYMLAKLTDVMEKLEINAERMARNIFFTKGLVFSQRVLLALTEAGLSREQAYALTQRNAMRCWEDGTPLLDALLNDREMRGVLKPQQISELFSLEPYMLHVDAVFQRVGLSEAAAPAPAKPRRGRAAKPRQLPATPPGTMHTSVVTEGGTIQNIAERPADYYEPAAHVPAAAAVPAPLDASDETLGEASHQKKRVRRDSARSRTAVAGPAVAEAAPAAEKAAPAPKPRRSRSRSDGAPAPASDRSQRSGRGSRAASAPAETPAPVPAPAAADAAAPLADGEAARKKRRRGTRGGRRHKKPGAATTPLESGSHGDDDSYVD